MGKLGDLFGKDPTKKDRALMMHPPQASMEGAHMGEDLDQTSTDEKAASHAIGQAYADPSVKPTDVEDSQEREPLNVKEAAEALPHWRRQITLRALIIGAGLGVFFAIVQQKLGLQAGVPPGFGLASCIVGFGAIRFVVIPCMVKVGLGSGWYYPQETTIIQTMANSVLDLNWGGGFHSFLVALSGPIIGNFEGQAGITSLDIYNPTIGRTLPYQICIGFIGIFVVLLLRKAMIIDFKLPWPSPTAAGTLIKSLHTKKGEEKARKQLRVLGITFSVAFLWDLFEWFFSGAGDCGFGSFPTFGTHALNYTWQFDFELTYVGVGMLVPHAVNASMMLGAIIMFGIILPVANQHSGDWYPPKSTWSNSKDVRGTYAYQVFTALGMFLGEGAYTILKVTILACRGMYRSWKAKRTGKVDPRGAGTIGRPPQGRVVTETEDERRLSEYVFLSNSIPWWVAVGGYLCFVAIGTGTIPQLYPPAKWYYCLVVYIIAPFFSIINAYCAGLTDWDITSAWSTLGVFIIGAWAGRASNEGAVVAALVMSGIAGAAVNAASSIMGDFKTAYYTLAHPRALLCTQLIGECVGLVMAPVIFYYLYYQPAISSGIPLGSAESQYAVPQAYVNLAAAIVSTEGIRNLPRHCFAIAGVFFFVCFFLPMFRDFGPRKIARFTPVPMAMAIPLVVGAWLAVDMGLGSIVRVSWDFISMSTATDYLVPAAAGLISGEGLWAVPEAVLALAKANPPLCMQFIATSAEAAT
ncbi:hypothetical protein WJX79_000741 [Trebouxia sp. C0005]